MYKLFIFADFSVYEPPRTSVIVGFSVSFLPTIVAPVSEVFVVIVNVPP